MFEFSYYICMFVQNYKNKLIQSQVAINTEMVQYNCPNISERFGKEPSLVLIYQLSFLPFLSLFHNIPKKHIVFLYKCDIT